MCDTDIVVTIKESIINLLSKKFRDSIVWKKEGRCSPVDPEFSSEL